MKVSRFEQLKLMNI